MYVYVALFVVTVRYTSFVRIATVTWCSFFSFFSVLLRLFCCRACGGEVSWHADVGYGATFAEDDPEVTHQVVDRPSVLGQRMDRYVCGVLAVRLFGCAGDFFGCVLDIFEFSILQSISTPSSSPVPYSFEHLTGSYYTTSSFWCRVFWRIFVLCFRLSAFAENTSSPSGSSTVWMRDSWCRWSLTTLAPCCLRTFRPSSTNSGRWKRKKVFPSNFFVRLWCFAVNVWIISWI